MHRGFFLAWRSNGRKCHACMVKCKMEAGEKPLLIILKKCIIKNIVSFREAECHEWLE